jgi:hypothetical protein
MERHLCLMGLINSPLCRGCGAEEGTSDHVLLSAKPWLHSDMHIWALFFFDLKDVESVWGQSGTAVTEQSSRALVLDYGAQRTCLKA